MCVKKCLCFSNSLGKCHWRVWSSGRANFDRNYYQTILTHPVSFDFSEFTNIFHQKLFTSNHRYALSPLSAKGFPKEFLAYMSNHALIYNEGRKQKACRQCKLGGVKYESGSMIITRYHCQRCDVPLCQGSRECYTAYHWQQWLRLRKGPHSEDSPSMEHQ